MAADAQRVRPDKAGRPIPAPLNPAVSAASTYNTLIGSTMIGRTYQFTSDPIPLEGAKRMLAAGARVHKFSLASFTDESRTKQVGSLLEAATNPDMGYADLFDLSFNRFVFWAYAVNNSNVYGEFYDLVSSWLVLWGFVGESGWIQKGGG